MNRNLYHLIKIGVFIILGTLIFIFNETLTNYAYLLVGSLMIMYGVEDFLYKFFTKGIRKHTTKIANSALIVLLGIVCLFLGPNEHFTSLCIIWATWGILREEWEIEEVVLHYNSKVVAILSIIESLFVVIISVIFIFNPTIESVHTHVIILGFELILEVALPAINNLLKGKDNEKEDL